MSGNSRTALITGANRGLGLATAGRLHELGFRVVVAARDARAAAEVASRLGEPARGLALDVTVPADIERAAAAAGEVDILVNNAGVMLDADTRPSSVPLSLAERTLAVNLLGSWRVTQRFLPGMSARGWGRVVMVSSGTGAFSNGIFPWAPAYSVSKAALNALTVVLARECEGSGVLVNAVNPGLARTRMRPSAPRSAEEAAQEIVLAATVPDGGPSGCFLRHGRPAPW